MGQEPASLETHHPMAQHVVRHVGRRFECLVEGQRSVLEYFVRDETMVITHTGVPPSLEGRGIASSLAKTAVEWAHEQDLSVDPQCWFVAQYMQRKGLSNDPPPPKHL